MFIPPIIKIMGGMNQLAYIIGGWADPSKMTAERKFLDTNPGQFDLGTTAAWSTLTLINGIGPGSSASQRIGRKVNLASILIKLNSRIKEGATFGGGPVRVLVVYDKQANAATPLITDILEFDHMNSPNNLSNRDRFVTVFDQIIPPVSVAGDFAQYVTLFKKLQLEQVFNSGVDNLIASISTGAMWIAFANVGTTNAVIQMKFTSRVRYTDV